MGPVKWPEAVGAQREYELFAVLTQQAMQRGLRRGSGWTGPRHPCKTAKQALTLAASVPVVPGTMAEQLELEAARLRSSGRAMARSRPWSCICTGENRVDRPPPGLPGMRTSRPGSI